MNHLTTRIFISALIIPLLIPCSGNAQEKEQENNPTFIIKGILVDNTGNPLKEKEMTVFIGSSETTVDTHADEPKKPGIGKQITGTGTLVMNIEGVTGGGAYKLMDGGIINPQTKTDEDGFFQFNVSSEFIEGVSTLIITVDLQDYSASYVTKSYPLVDDEGNPLILNIGEEPKMIDLGEVEHLKM